MSKRTIKFQKPAASSMDDDGDTFPVTQRRFGVNDNSEVQGTGAFQVDQGDDEVELEISCKAGEGKSETLVLHLDVRTARDLGYQLLTFANYLE
jgi:hypothetical protein